jgi:hypothetical protein
VNSQPTFSIPRCLTFRIKAIVFSQPKALLDSLPLLLTDRISGMPRRPFINRAASAARAVLRYMWCDVQVPAFRYEVPRV